MSAAEPLTATIRVIAGTRRSQPVNRHLFGKFTEHLGQNVYGGAWAQITLNPEFAPIDSWPDRGEILRRLQAAATEFSLPALAGGPALGLPPWWVLEDPSPAMGSSWYALSPSERRGHWTLALTIPETGGAQARLVTPVYLPTHRTRQLTLTLFGRSSCSLEASIRTAAGQVTLAKASTGALTQDTSTGVGGGSGNGTSVGPTGGSAVARAVNLTLTFSEPGPEELPPPGTPYHLVLTPTSPGRLELYQCLLFPADHIDGWDPDVVRFLREARLPLLRFPGGNFASGYHWEDGIGPIQNRPVLPNPAWPEVEWNHVGTDEWLHLCELVGCEPLICINAGNGSPEEAARWVEYCNGPAETTAMGALRALNGHPQPYNVRLWEVGNELYGHWQVGHTDALGYAERYRAFAAAMLAIDPNIHLIANGDTEAWNRTVVQGTNGRGARSSMRLPGSATPTPTTPSPFTATPIHSLSHHCLYAGFPDNADPERVYLEHMAFTPAYARLWRQLVRPLDEAGLRPALAITEQQVFTHRRHLPNNATLTEALWTASIINEAIRSDGLVELLTHSALVNHGGGLRKEREIVYAQPIWWVTHLYATATATATDTATAAATATATATDTATPAAPFYRLELAVDSPTFSVEPYVMPVVPDAPFLDAVALTDGEERELLLFLVNRHPHHPLAVRLNLAAPFTPDRLHQLTTTTLTSSSYMDSNSWDDPDRVHPVTERMPLPVVAPVMAAVGTAVDTDAVQTGEWKLTVTLPALSLVQVRLTP